MNVAPHEAKRLIRDPAEWASAWGWISRLRAERIARDLRVLASEIENSAMGDPAAKRWASEVRKIAKRVEPKMKRSVQS